MSRGSTSSARPLISRARAVRDAVGVERRSGQPLRLGLGIDAGQHAIGTHPAQQVEPAHPGIGPDLDCGACPGGRRQQAQRRPGGRTDRLDTDLGGGRPGPPSARRPPARRTRRTQQLPWSAKPSGPSARLGEELVGADAAQKWRRVGNHCWSRGHLAWNVTERYPERPAVTTHRQLAALQGSSQRQRILKERA